jgi:outer membrane receptor protein involved in Fe transport
MLCRALAAVLAATAASTPTPPPDPNADGTSAPKPAFSEEVSVVSTRFDLPVREAPASVAVVESDDLHLSPSPALDDTLRQVPGLTLFRRSGSRTANPTTQGASLRGIGGSGAGRAAVLLDGVPLADPFGGWIYWSRVPRAAVDRVEILRGGGSDLYGSGALGGVVRLFRRDTDDDVARIETSVATQGTPEVSAWGRHASGPWAVDAAGEYFRTDGYVLVDEAERGTVDTRAGSRHATGELGVSRELGSRGHAFVRGSLFDEHRDNGTPVQTNDTTLRQGTAGLDAALGAGHLSLRAYLIDQDYDQTFSTITADRASERLNRTQAVAAQAAGGSAEYAWARGRHHLAAGIDARRVHGDNDELAIGGTVQSPTQTPTDVVGVQRTAGAFVEDRLTVGRRTSVVLGLRGDAWRNEDARRTTAGVGQDLAARAESALSPRAAVVHEVFRGATFVASAYRAFRAPTLNELYRGFRVGNVQTQPNEALEAEHLTGFDAGLRVAVRDRLLLRGTAFQMTVDDPVANVTVSTTPALITRQRKNLGSTRSHGLELDAEWRPSRVLVLRAAYLFTDATVRSFSEDPTLVGRFVPQVARHGGTLSARVQGGLGSAWLQARWVGAQFDDDQNQLRLAPFVTLDARVERPLAHGLTAFAAVENLGGVRYDVGRTPTRTIGPPRSLRVGVTLDLKR